MKSTDLMGRKEEPVQTSTNESKRTPPEPDIGVQLMDTAKLLQAKLNKKVQLKKDLIDLTRKQGEIKAKYIQEANELKDEDGKPKLRNESMREAYVKEKLTVLTITQDRWDKENELAQLDADVEGLNYEFRALRAIIEYRGRQFEFLGSGK